MTPRDDNATGPRAGAAPTDEQLGRRALDGDRDAFERLFARYEGGLYNVTLRLTGSREDAADITQEAFLRVYARLEELLARGIALRPYLHRTARNLVYDHGAHRSREVPSDTIERDAGPDPALDADPERHALFTSQGADVRAASDRLPARQRLVLALRELEGMSYADIGRALDVSEGAVAQLLARARFGLRRELRLQQVDPERMDPACRARLGYIGALIDGELPPERAHDLAEHVGRCPTCRASREAFEDARTRYRQWLPVPVAGLGLAAEAARAAEGVDAPPGDDDHDLDDFGAEVEDPAAELAAVIPPVRGGRLALLVGGGTLLVLLLGGAVLVGMRSGSEEPAPAPAPNVAEAPAATVAAPARTRPRRAATATTTGTTTTTTDGDGTTTDGAVAAAPSRPPAPAPRRPGTTVVSGVVRVGPAPTTRRTTTTAPGGAVVGTPPAAGGGSEPSAPATSRTDAPEPPATTDEPPTTEAPPTTETPPTTDTAPTTPTDTAPGL